MTLSKYTTSINWRVFNAMLKRYKKRCLPSKPLRRQTMEDTGKEDNMDSWGRSAGRGSPRSSQIYSRSHRSHVARAHPQHHQNARGRKIISGRRSLVGHSRVDVDTASARPKGHNRQAPAFGTIGSPDNRILLDRMMLQSRKKPLPSSKSLERAL